MSLWKEVFFTFMNRKKSGVLQQIGRISCKEAYKLYSRVGVERRPFLSYIYDFCFEDDLPIYDEEKTIVEEGDIINILTNINISVLNVDLDDSYIGNTYLATFLIELDPL